MSMMLNEIMLAAAKALNESNGDMLEKLKSMNQDLLQDDESRDALDALLGAMLEAADLAS